MKVYTFVDMFHDRHYLCQDCATDDVHEHKDVLPTKATCDSCGAVFWTVTHANLAYVVEVTTPTGQEVLVMSMARGAVAYHRQRQEVTLPAEIMDIVRERFARMDGLDIAGRTAEVARLKAADPVFVAFPAPKCR